MTPAPLALCALVAGYQVGVLVGEYRCHESAELATRATRLAEVSVWTAGRCVEAATQTRAGLGVLWPSVGGVGGTTP